jgi:toxin YhaV
MWLCRAIREDLTNLVRFSNLTCHAVGIKRVVKQTPMAQTPSPIIVNGWTLRFHASFIQQATHLRSQVEFLRQKDLATYRSKKAAKRFAALLHLVFEVIPQDPERNEYRQGDTLGPKYKNWFRAKFLQQYRLFFRYNKESRIIIFGWVNDDQTKRAYDSKTDAYRVFRKMLDSGNPPDDWEALLEVSTADYGAFLDD